MEWKECSGSGQPAMTTGESGRYKAMCPVCTKYVTVRVGQPCPQHEIVVINSQSNEPQRELRR